MSPHDTNLSFKEWRPSNSRAIAGAEILRHGFLCPLKVRSPRRTFARIDAALRKGRIVSTFANKTLLVLGPHHDSPYVPFFDEDMKQYNRQIA